jgi:hypothetical protein
MTNRARVLLLATTFLFASCRRSPPPELWIIPKGFVGWLRLDYSVAGAPILPLENGRRVVRMPPEARLQTSTADAGSIVDNRYAVDGPAGREQLPSFSLKLGNPPFGMQNAYTLSKGPIGSRQIQLQHACVFVGTPNDFRTNGRNCDAWPLGDPLPPKYPKRRTLENDGKEQ